MVVTALPAPSAPARPLRLAALFGLVCLFALGIGGRLTYWQVLRASSLQRQITAEHTLDETVPAARGRVLDAKGDLLAGNLSVDYVYAVPNQIQQPAEVAARLAPFLDVAVDSLLPALSDTSKPYVRLAGGRKFPSAVTENVQKLAIPGIFLEPATERVYPEVKLASHVLGFVDGDSKGWYGVEGQYGDVVGGRPGRLQAERDTAGNEIAFSSRQWSPPQDGDDLVLTIDRTMQYIAERELDRAIVQHAASGGTVIVMDPRTGAIKAMASRPAFDPNKYQEAADHTEVFVNPAVTSQYEPGSTFKLVMMAAALNEGAVTPDTTYMDNGVLMVSGVPIRNWDLKANGLSNMVTLLQKSSNVGASWVATTKLGKDRFYRYVNLFGFGQPTGIDLQGEASGTVRDPSSKAWGPTDLATNSFGQAISVTPIQLITAVSAIANGGIMMRPYVVDSVRDPHSQKVLRQTRPQIARQVISRETAATLMGMMVSAAEDGETHGTLVPGFHVAGKTGTASIPVAGGYDPELTIASFVGAVPANDPQFVVLVKIDKPTDDPWGSLIAKPAFAIIAQELTRYLKLAPTVPITPSATAVPTPAAPAARPGSPPVATAAKSH